MSAYEYYKHEGKRRGGPGAGLALGLGAWRRPARAATAPGAPPFGVRIEDTTLTLPDGVRLAVNVFLPEGAPPAARLPADPRIPALPAHAGGRARGAVPVPAGRDRFAGRAAASTPSSATATWASRVDVRGTGRSEGLTPDREYSEQEQLDGMEVIAWIARQPWCDGNVGMWGVSWGGFNSLQMAARQPPALKAILAMHATEDLFQDDIHYIDGLFHYDEYELSMDLATR